MAAMRKDGSPVARALEVLIPTAVRTGDLSFARWCEFDLDKQLWTIPKARMKMRKDAENRIDHEVPLGEPVSRILKAIKAIENLRTTSLRASAVTFYMSVRCRRRFRRSIERSTSTSPITAFGRRSVIGLVIKLSTTVRRLSWPWRTKSAVSRALIVVGRLLRNGET